MRINELLHFINQNIWVCKSCEKTHQDQLLQKLIRSAKLEANKNYITHAQKQSLLCLRNQQLSYLSCSSWGCFFDLHRSSFLFGPVLLKKPTHQFLTTSVFGAWFQLWRWCSQQPHGQTHALALIDRTAYLWQPELADIAGVLRWGNSLKPHVD